MIAKTIEPELLTINEAARVLRVGRSRAYLLASSGQMPGLIRIGRSIRVSRRALLAWIADQTNHEAD